MLRRPNLTVQTHALVDRVLMDGSQAVGLFAKSNPNILHADLGYNVLAFSRENFQAEFDRWPGLTLIVYDLRPSSRGELKLAGKDPRAAPSICVNYLDTPRDQQVVANAIRLTRRTLMMAEKGASLMLNPKLN